MLHIRSCCIETPAHVFVVEQMAHKSCLSEALPLAIAPEQETVSGDESARGSCTAHLHKNC